MTSSAPLVWFITGSSSGIGAALAIHILKAGHKVIATARNPSSASSFSEIKSLGGHWIALDVNSPTASSVLVESAKVFGMIDVLVNNAGYSILGAVEDISDEEAHAQLLTNFFSPLRLIRSVLPLFRAQSFGTIVNISSVAGIDGGAASGLYAASKFALEGLSESIAKEVSSFGIKVLIVEPGAFRTNFLGIGVKKPARQMNPAYKGTVSEDMLKILDGMDGKQRGDTRKAVSVLFDVVTRSGVAVGLEGNILRLPLGSDCVERWEKKVKEMGENLDAVRGFVEGLDLKD